MKLLLATLLFSTLSFAQETNKTLEDYLHSTDKFTGEKTYYTPYSKNINAFRIIGSSGTRQYFSLKVYGATLNYECKGVYILFENGEKIIRPEEKIDTKYDNGYRYSAFFVPTEKEIELFKNSKITDVKLYIYDSVINNQDATKFLEAAKVILTTSNR